MQLPLNLLRSFEGVVQAGGFSRAAALLHVSQPAISKAVRELEQHVGAVLIDRGPGKLRLTEAGTLLAQRAREIFAIERMALTEMREHAGLETGTLSLGASTTIAAYHAPALLARFHASHPGVTLRLISANTEAILEQLAAREIDIALVEGPVADPRVSVLPWRQEAMLLVASPRHPACQPGTALAQALFVLREPGSGTRAIALAALSRIGITPARILQAGSTEAITHLVAAGVGVSVLPQAAVSAMLASGALVALPMPPYTRALSQLVLPGRQPGRAAAAFAALLREGASGGQEALPPGPPLGPLAPNPNSLDPC